MPRRYQRTTLRREASSGTRYHHRDSGERSSFTAPASRVGCVPKEAARVLDARRTRCVVAMEAGSSHYFGREIGKLAMLVPSTAVREAQKLCEAASLRFVAVKTREQQARGMLFRTRDLGSPAHIPLRGHFADGVVAPQGPAHVEPANRSRTRALFVQIAELDEKIADLEQELRERAREDEQTVRLMGIARDRTTDSDGDPGLRAAARELPMRPGLLGLAGLGSPAELTGRSWQDIDNPPPHDDAERFAAHCWRSEFGALFTFLWDPSVDATKTGAPNKLSGPPAAADVRNHPQGVRRARSTAPTQGRRNAPGADPRQRRDVPRPTTCNPLWATEGWRLKCRRRCSLTMLRDNRPQRPYQGPRAHGVHRTSSGALRQGLPGLIAVFQNDQRGGEPHACDHTTTAVAWCHPARPRCDVALTAAWRRSRCGTAAVGGRATRRPLASPSVGAGAGVAAVCAVTCRAAVRGAGGAGTVGGGHQHDGAVEAGGVSAQVTDRTTVSRALGISWQAVGSIVERVVSRRLARRSRAARSGADEFSYRKRHDGGPPTSGGWSGRQAAPRRWRSSSTCWDRPAANALRW